MVTAGGMPGVAVAATPALLYICYGLFGLAGLLTGRVKAMIGLPMLLRLLMLAGACRSFWSRFRRIPGPG